jgi:uncharacterized protein
MNDRTGRIVASSIEFAVDSRSRRTGLLGRSVLPDRHALILAPSNGIHTFGMRFPIDVIFLTRAGKVTKTRPDLGPSRVCFALSAYAVIELPVGALQSSETRRGDVLCLVPEIAESSASV